MMYDVLAAATSAKFLWSNYVGSRLDLQLRTRKRNKKKRINDRTSVEIPQNIFSWRRVSHRLPADVQKNIINYPAIHLTKEMCDALYDFDIASRANSPPR
jgi:hypothetical protein